jgi:hypothetical protein
MGNVFPDDFLLKAFKILKQGLTFSVSALKRPMVIKPFIFKVENSAIFLVSSTACSGAIPNLLSSLEVLT